MKQAILVLFILVYPYFAQCAENTEKFLVTIPINAEANSKHYLNVSGPDGYKSIEPRSPFYENKSNIITFIPAHEKETYYSQRFVLMVGIGAKMPASQAIEMLETNLRSSRADFKKLDRMKASNKIYDEGTLIASYRLGEFTWITYAKYYSGPKDLAGVIYEMAIPDSMSEKDSIMKAKEFIKKYVRVLEINQK